MKVCILVPSDASLEQAGVRIRYNHIAEHFESQSVFLDVRPIADFYRSNTFNYDIFILSKCYDAGALLLSHQLKQQAKVVGVDIFDDYFSQVDDSRLARYQVWLRQLSNVCDFCLCSTEHMRRVATQYVPNKPVHILNDPYESLNSESLANVIESKHSQWVSSKTLKIGWFGIGDNPHFSVGLSDLSAFANELIPLKELDYKFVFELLTNERALTSDNLALLKNLPFDYTIEIWSEEKEKAKLSEWLACVLPVNSQSFSIGKSLNRAITALTSGTQVLSLGYPLYKPLHEFLYRDVEDFVHALKTNSELKLSSSKVEKFLSVTDNIANPKVEASRLNAFLNGLDNENEDSTCGSALTSYGVLHGKVSNGISHQLVQYLSGYSIASPFNKLKLNFDIRIIANRKSSELEFYLCNKTLNAKLPELKNCVTPASKFADRSYYLVNAEYFDCGTEVFIPQSIDLLSSVAISLSYNSIMQKTITMLNQVIPDLQLIISEQSKDPWHFGGSN